MKKNICLMTCLVGLACCIMLTLFDLAEAKRMGGGKSFGSSPSYSKNYQNSAPSPSGPARMGTPGASSPGRSALGGMFGGLLLGGLLGSLFFGGPFSGLNLMDMLLIGGGLFFLFRLLRSRRPAVQAAGDAPSARASQDNSWEHLRSQGAAGPSAISVPKGFDSEEFLAGARAAYLRLQDAWDKRDLEAVRQFTSPEVFAEIATQAKEDPTPGKTEILMVDARLLEVKTVGNQTVATVLFDVLLREGAAADPAGQVREAWHFSRYETGGDKYWVVEGIQQMQ